MSTEPESPRYTVLPKFAPHRVDFTCIHQAEVVPPIDPEAEAWHQEAIRVTGYHLWAEKRDYLKAAELWAKAAKRKHWKAALNLSSLYLAGQGVPPDVYKAIEIVEEAARWGVPDAWDLLGKYHMQGLAGLKRDATVAYAFWQKAAEMGSPGAQAYLGRSLITSVDDPQSGKWHNPKIGYQMLLCSFDQGYGKAAYDLGKMHSVSMGYEKFHKDHTKSLHYFHEGVKFGSEDCANYLERAFAKGPQNSVAPTIDRERERRYLVFGDALGHNPDLRFPNLDKVLPLPPAKLPYWDGKPESLLNAAKPVHPQPGAPKVSVVYPHPLERLGYLGPMSRQFDIPAGFALKSWSGSVVDAGQAAPADGYYQPVIDPRHQDNPLLAIGGYNRPYLDEPRLTPPAFFRAGEVLPNWRGSSLADRSGALLEGLRYRQFGMPVPVPPSAQHPAVLDGRWRGIAALAPAPAACPHQEPCPQSGIWVASLAPEHPAFARQDLPSTRQAYVHAGEAFPLPYSLRTPGLDLSVLRWSRLEDA